MNEWKKVKIGEFLTEREGRFKPDDKRISKYKRLDKINFSGNIHLSNKPTKTDMILVQPGDLVISGINVAKGAITVYQGEEPVCATIHYSSYTFDSSKVDLDYFKFFVKSAAFIAAMQKQVKGGIKTEIKPKHLLALEISIPDLGTQKKIVKEISSQLEKTEQLSSEIEKQKSYAKQLRQNILQEAIEGKLTADWRKQHPVQKGNPDYDAEALFEKIQIEKQEKGKKQKSLPAITETEKPFAIPSGWKWVRLGDMSYNRFTGPFGSMLHKSDYVESGIPLINPTNIKDNGINYSTCMMISQKKYQELSHYTLSKNDIILARRGDLSKCGIVQNSELQICGTGCFFMKLLSINNLFFKLVYISKTSQAYLLQDSIGQTMDNLNQKLLEKLPIPLPPLAEQKEIVARVEQHLQTITQLETQIATRETTTKQLMQSILKDAFGEG